ncbi:MAG TPA: SMC-Scp complex subunit ScpB [Candidatus Paceibacterota bacterium]
MPRLSEKIHAILFLKGEGMKVKEIQKITGAGEGEVEEALEVLEEELKDCGVRLITNGEKYKLATAPEFNEITRKLGEEEFSPDIGKAGLEVLSIVVYKGKVGRPEIDYIRGVNSGFTVRNLLVRGLIEREVRKSDSRAFLYGPSLKLLEHLGIASLAELPEYKKVKKGLEEYELLRGEEYIQTDSHNSGGS